MAVPVLTREQLLDYANILNILKQTSIQDEFKTLDNLKQQCKQNGVSTRDFDKLVKQVKFEIDNQNKPVANTNKDCLPSCITNTGDNYIIDDDGIKVIIGNLITEVCPHPIFPVEILRD